MRRVERGRRCRERACVRVCRSSAGGSSSDVRARVALAVACAQLASCSDPGAHGGRRPRCPASAPRACFRPWRQFLSRWRICRDGVSCRQVSAGGVAVLCPHHLARGSVGIVSGCVHLGKRAIIAWYLPFGVLCDSPSISLWPLRHVRRPIARPVRRPAAQVQLCHGVNIPGSVQTMSQGKLWR